MTLNFDIYKTGNSMTPIHQRHQPATGLRKGLWLTALAAVLAVPARAQQGETGTPVTQNPFTGTAGFRTWSVGVHAGALAAIAPIGGSNDFTKWKPTLGYGLYVKKQISHMLGIQAEFLKGTLSGDNSKNLGNGQPPNRAYSSFKTDLNWSAGLSGVISFGNINFLHEKIVMVPYLTLGGGLVDYNPKPVVAATGQELNYKADGSIKELYIPVGAGIKFKAAQGVNIDIGYRMNFVDGDNLDGYYYGPQKDRFSYAFAGIEFAFGKKSKPQLQMNNPAARLRSQIAEDNFAMQSAMEKRLKDAEQRNAEQIAAMQSQLDQFKEDSDGDGVSDYFDKCPGTASGVKVDGTGCPLPKPPAPVIVVTEEDRRVVDEAIRNLEFDLGKATIRSSSYPSLNRVADILVKKNFSLKLAGHTDNIGSDESNLKLSKDRAESVKAYLVSQGANPSRIEATGYGESQPITSNKTAAGRQKNRRVEFTLF
ncbi:OmpA family protein [Taibaiella koreensis]|uniref:OmpA family protein n=1 Tax=Taibaiella koreensis TaxID=1268548 RepID=UPI000E59FD8F|nr:OmpA family protein [Taibaiella koreensis]